jgi:hypothetical protein
MPLPITTPTITAVAPQNPTLRGRSDATSERVPGWPWTSLSAAAVMGRKDSDGPLAVNYPPITDSSSNSNSAGPRLDYAPAPPLHRREWVWRLVVRPLVIAIVLLLALYWGRVGYDWSVAMRYRRALARAVQKTHAYLPPTTQHVVYDDDPQTYPNLLTGGGAYLSTFRTIGGHKYAGYNNPDYDGWLRLAANLGGVSPVAFLHELTSPNGTRRAVAIQMLSMPQDPYNRFFFAPNVIDAPPPPANSLSVMSPNLVMYRAAGASLRVYDGLADPNDASRFTFVVEHHGRRIDVRGQLRDDGKVILTPAVGQVADFRTELTWIPPGVSIPRTFEPSCFVDIATTRPTQYLGPGMPGMRQRIENGMLIQEDLRTGRTFTTTAPAMPY